MPIDKNNNEGWIQLHEFWDWSYTEDKEKDRYRELYVPVKTILGIAKTDNRGCHSILTVGIFGNCTKFFVIETPEEIGLLMQEANEY